MFNTFRLNSNLPSKIIEVLGVERIEKERIFLKDQSFVTADVFMFCTGYRYSFPFLDENCEIRVDSNFITPLYKHLININHPCMCIVGVPTVVVPFPMFHMQVIIELNYLNMRIGKYMTHIKCKMYTFFFLFFRSNIFSHC